MLLFFIGNVADFSTHFNIEKYYRYCLYLAICSLQEDVYAPSETLLIQDDITLIEKKNYIKNPKPNGYRSLHLIVAIPIFWHIKSG